jgi:hypothetical protein
MIKAMIAALTLLIASCCIANGMAENPDTTPPSRYTVTHEATFHIVIKENPKSPEILAEGTVVIGLFGDVVPMTVLNFVTITNGVVRSNVSTTRKEIDDE